MRKHDLANQLRERAAPRLVQSILDQGLDDLPPLEQIEQDVGTDLRSYTDTDIIDAYNKCCCCGERRINDKRVLKRIICESIDSDDFLRRCNMAAMN